MLDEDYEAFGDGERTVGGIHTAVEAWLADPAAAKHLYGPIASWNTSEVMCSNYFRSPVSPVSTTTLTPSALSPQVTDMSGLFDDSKDGHSSFNGDLSRWDVGQVTNMHGMFSGATSFNGDLSSWDVGQVTTMHRMFWGATSFNHQLGGTWSQSTASRTGMFSNSPGSIA